MNSDFASLTEAFLNYFKVDLVTTASQIDEVAQLRYRVYCEEFGYERPQDFPDRRERDNFDAHSMHCLVTHRRSGHTAGCVRLVCATDELALPLETHCLESLYLDHLESMTLNRDQVCEVSRAAVDSRFRKRSGEDHTRLGEFDAMDCSHQERRSFSLVGIALFLSTFAMANLSGRDQLFAMMESNLPRLLRRAGIVAQQAGEEMDYHGRRAPYFITTDLALANMRDDLHVLYEALYERLGCHYRTCVQVA